MVEALEELQSVKQITDATAHWNPDVSNAENKQRHLEKSDTNIGDAKNDAPEGVRGNNLEPPAAEQKVTGWLEPSLSDPKPGNPISHGQIIDLWRATQAQNVLSTTLDVLMRGSRIYITPSEPKQEPVYLSLQLRSITC